MVKKTLLILSLILLLGGVWVYVKAASVGPNYASTITDYNPFSNQIWTNPNNASGAPDGVYATNFLGLFVYSSQLNATNFGFSIPTNATINGILVDVYSHVSNPAGNLGQVQILKNGGSSTGIGNINSTAFTTSDTNVLFGGATELWTTTWTPSDINSSNFGASLDVRGQTAANNYYIDDIQITVTYTLPSGAIQQQMRSGTVNVRSGRVNIK